MQDIQRKIRLILIPFLLISIAFVGLYTFLTWWLFIKSESFPINEKYLHVYLPIAVGIIASIIIFQRFRLLNLKTSKGSWDAFLGVMIGLAVSFSIMAAQEYLEIANEKLTSLEYISQINILPKTKFYTLKHKVFDKDHSKSHGVYDWQSTKANSDLYFKIYYVVPIIDSLPDTAKHNCLAFIGIEYFSEKVDNGNFPKFSEAERNKLWDRFASHSDSDFAKSNLSTFVYLDRLGVTDSHDNYLEALKETPYRNIKDLPILIPVNTSFSERGKSTRLLFYNLIAFLSFILVIILTLVLKFDPVKLYEFENRNSKT